MVSHNRRGGGLARNFHGYHRTDHFIYRQWQRGVPDWILVRALSGIVQGDFETHVAISRNRLKWWKLQGLYKGPSEVELFIVIKNGYLTTLYFAPICLGRCTGRKNCETILIQ